MAYINGNQIYFGVVGTRSGSDVNVVQETGQSTEDVISQKAVTDNLNKKIDVAEYSALAHVVEKDNGINSSFIKRTTGGTADVADGVATIKSIKGNTIVWNQVYDSASYLSISGNGITFTNNGDGSFTINGTATGINTAALSIGSIPSTHKLLYCGCPVGGSVSTYNFYNGMSATGADTGHGYITNAAPISNAARAYIRVMTGVTVNNVVFKPQVFDLTAMFGAGNEPATVAEFKALFTNDYYEHDAGSLLSFNGNGIKTVGYNMYNGTTANVIAGKEYYISGSYSELNLNDVEITPVNGLFTPQTSGDLFVFGGGADTCISLSSTRNGEYDDYWTITQNIPIAKYFPNGMRKVGEICDELTANKAIKRIGSRTYQSGDENDNAVITDGNNTFYVLTDPTVVVIGTPINLSYSVAKYGTEEITTADNEMTSPCNMIIAYSVNLPQDFISKKSFDEFCAALETALNCTITATWDDSNGKYTYTIVI